MTTAALAIRRPRTAEEADTLAAGSRGITPGRVGLYAALIVLAACWLAPFLWAINTSFKSEADASATPITIVPPHGYTLERWATIFNAGNVPLWMGNSALTSIAVTAITVVVSVLAAYAFSRLDFPARKVIYAVTIASIMVPAQIFIIPLFDQMLALDLVDTYWGVILPQCIAPVMIFVLKRFFDDIPRELEDAARVDGASHFRILLSVVLPLSRSIIAAVAIFVFIGAWNNFLWPFIVTNDPNLMTLPVGLQTVTPGYGVVDALKMAQAVLAAAPLIIVFLFFQRQIIRGISTTGIAGS